LQSWFILDFNNRDSDENSLNLWNLLCKLEIWCFLLYLWIKLYDDRLSERQSEKWLVSLFRTEKNNNPDIKAVNKNVMAESQACIIVNYRIKLSLDKLL